MMPELSDALIEHLWTEGTDATFASAILYPHRHLIRVVEHISYVDQTTLRRTIDFEVSLHSPSQPEAPAAPATAVPPRTHSSNSVQPDLSRVQVAQTWPRDTRDGLPGIQLFPILGFAKNRLLNDVPIVHADGKRLQLLNRSQSQIVHEYAIKLLVMASLGDWAKAEDTVARASATRTIAWRLATIAYETPAEAQRIVASVFEGGNGNRGDYDADGARMGPGDVTPLDNAYAQVRANTDLRQLCERLATHEYMVLACPSAENRWLSLQITYDSLHVQRERSHSRGGWLRRLTGQLPHGYRIHVPLALRAQSYHIRMDGPPEHYVWEQSFRTPARPATAADTARGVGHPLDLLPPPTPPAVVLGLPARPTREAHLYAGGLSRKHSDRLYARLVFFERLPGMQGMAVLLAGSLLALLVSFLFSLEPLARDGNLSAGVSSIILLAPGVAAALVVPSLADSRVSQGPLVARLVLLGTTGLAFVSAVLLVSLAAHTGPGGELSKVGLSLWIALSVSQGGLLGIAVWRYLRALAGYRLALELESKRSYGNDSVDIYGSDAYNWLIDNKRTPTHG